MTSLHTAQPMPMNSPASSLEDAPLLNLLGESMTEMSAEKLREYVTQLRDVTSSPMTLKKMLQDKKEAAKPAKKGAATMSAASLADKYSKK